LNSRGAAVADGAVAAAAVAAAAAVGAAAAGAAAARTRQRLNYSAASLRRRRTWPPSNGRGCCPRLPTHRMRSVRQPASWPGWPAASPPSAAPSCTRPERIKQIIKKYLLHFPK